MECMAIYRPREQDNYFLCLGSRGKWAALGMPVKRMQASGQHYFILGAEPALDWHFTQVPILEHDMTGGYMGVPTVAWPPSELPESMANLGVVWKQSAEEEPLLRFALRTAVKINKDELQSLCISVRARRPPKSKTTVAVWAATLYRKVFADLPEEECNDLIREFLKGKDSPHPDDATVLQACEHLDEANKKHFEHLQKKIQRSLDVEESKATEQALEAELQEAFAADADPVMKKNVARTPAWWRQFIPGAGTLIGCYLHRLPNRKAYAAYYPGPVPSQTLSWGGPLARRTECEALCGSIRFLWRQHQFNRKEQRPDDLLDPTPEELAAAVVELEAAQQTKKVSKGTGRGGAAVEAPESHKGGRVVAASGPVEADIASCVAVVAASGGVEADTAQCSAAVAEVAGPCLAEEDAVVAGRGQGRGKGRGRGRERGRGRASGRARGVRG